MSSSTSPINIGTTPPPLYSKGILETTPSILEKQLQELSTRVDALSKQLNILHSQISEERTRTDQWFENGIKNLKLGRYENAIIDFTLAINGRNGNPANAYMGRGIAHAKLKEASEAMEDFNFVEHLKPNDLLLAETLYQKSILFIANGEYEEGIKHLTNLIDFLDTLDQIDEDFLSKIYYERARAYVEMGLYDEQANDIRKALETKPNDLNYANKLDGPRSIYKIAELLSIKENGPKETKD